MTAQLDTGLQSLLMMASLHGIPADEAKLRHEFGQTSGLFDTNTILLAAKQLGFTARAVLQKPERLDKAPLPAVARGKDGGFFVLAKYSAGSETVGFPGSEELLPTNAKILIQRPGNPPEVVSASDFSSLWSGELIFLLVH